MENAKTACQTSHSAVCERVEEDTGFVDAD